MIQRHAYTLSLLFLTLSCTYQSLPQNTANQSVVSPVTVDQAAVNPPLISTDIRPGPNGPKLELTELEGELLIPVGTSAFVLQSDATLALAARIGHYLIPPAHAAESEDAAIDLATVQKLSASVNGQGVPLEILGLENSEEGQILSYRLKDVPVSDSSALIEFKSQSGSFVIRGLIEKVELKMKRIDERFDLDSTALAYIWESLGEDRPKKLDKKALDLLKQQSAVQQLKNRLYEHMIAPELRSNKKPVQVKDFLLPMISQALQADPEVTDYLKQAQRCAASQGQANNCSLPDLKPVKSLPFPPNSVSQAAQRESERRRALKLKVNPSAS